MIPLPRDSRLFPDAEATARAAAEHLVALVEDGPSRRLAVSLSGGSTPRRLYEILAGPDFRDRLPWDRIDWFFGDDRVVPHHDPLSNVCLVRDAFGAAMPEARIHPMPTEAGKEAGAAAYAGTLRAFYGSDHLDPKRPLFDLVLLGLGADGHTASLFPGKPAVNERDAWVVAVPEAGMEPFVPRISLTFPALASSRSVLFLVNGAGKRDPLSRLAAGEDLPAGRAWSVGALNWYIDRAAADA